MGSNHYKIRVQEHSGSSGMSHFSPYKQYDAQVKADYCTVENGVLQFYATFANGQRRMVAAFTSWIYFKQIVHNDA